jgi:hypothetical protein
MANLPHADLILMLGEVLFQVRRMLEIATLRFLQTAKREKLHPGQRLIEELFSPHSSLIADKIVHHDVSRGIIKRLIAASLGVTRVAEPDIGASFPGLLTRNSPGPTRRPQNGKSFIRCRSGKARWGTRTNIQSRRSDHIYPTPAPPPASGLFLPRAVRRFA